MSPSGSSASAPHPRNAPVDRQWPCGLGQTRVVTRHPDDRLLEVHEIRTSPVRTDCVRSDERTAAETVRVAFDQYQDRIYGMLLASSRDRDAAADITQETFLRLLAEVRGGRSPQNTGAWLYRVALNLLVSRARRAAGARRVLPRLLRPERETDTPETVILGHEASQAAVKALARLSLIERTAVVLAAQGVSGLEIAAYLGKRPGATRSMLLRARKKLRQSLAEPEDRG